MKHFFPVTLFAAAAVLCSAATVSALDPLPRCAASKLKTAGKYGFCRLTEEAKAVKTFSQPDFSKCDAKFSAKWARAEARAMGQCPSTGDAAAIQAFINQHTDDLAAALAGGPLPDCTGDLATCANDLGTCNDSVGICNTNLTDCNSSLMATTVSLTTCNENLATCATDLTTALACGNGTIDDGEQCDQGNLNGATCVTQGFIGGILRCGNGCTFDTNACSVARFIDNGDRTVTDLQTGLMWEKKDDLGGIHDKDNSYTWSATGTAPDGAAFMTFLRTLNYITTLDDNTSECFASHCDWRLPTIAELRTILLTPFPCETHPCIDPIFGPTRSDIYWSATTNGGSPASAWTVSFNDGRQPIAINKAFNFYVRAVRGGP